MPLIPGGGRARFRADIVPDPVGKAVLSPSDFTYLGVLKFPLDASGIRFGYSHATTLTTRYVSGNLKILAGMSQATSATAGYLCEMNYATPNLTIASANRMSVYRTWGDIYQNRQVQEPTGLHQFGFLWDDEDEKLLWSYGPRYSGIHERSLGATELHSNFTMTKHGTWRTQCHSKQSNGYMTKIPSEYRSSLGGADVLVGGIQTSINAQSTFGYSLHAFDSSNLLGTPADNYTNISSISVPTTRLMMGDINNRMSRNPTWIPCSKGEPPYDCSNGSLGVPTSTVSDIDIGQGCAWIEGASKHGLVFVGQFVDRVNSVNWRNTYYNGDDLPHQWYATAGSTCCHGHHAFLDGTGPHTPSLVPQMWIYDPDVLVKVNNGQMTAYQAANSPTHSHKHLYDYSSSNFPQHRNYYLTGCAYDPVGGLFFVSIADIDYTSQFEGLPHLHVFQVAA